MNPTASDLNQPLSERESCVMIIQARIRDLRALEKFLKDQKMPCDEKIFAKKIGGLRKCIEYIQKH